MPDIVKINIQTEGIQKALQKAIKHSGDLRPLLANISGIMHDAVEENFEQEGRPKWPSLSKRTIRARKRRGHWPGKILQASGQLAGSIVPGSDDRSAWVSTNKIYAPIQQFGGEIHHSARPRILHFKKYRSGKHKGKTLFSKPSRATYGRKVSGRAYTVKIPPRPFLKLTEQDINRIEDAIKEFIINN